jgi:hypothetical protein
MIPIPSRMPPVAGHPFARSSPAGSPGLECPSSARLEEPHGRPSRSRTGVPGTRHHITIRRTGTPHQTGLSAEAWASCRLRFAVADRGGRRRSVAASASGLRVPSALPGRFARPASGPRRCPRRPSGASTGPLRHDPSLRARQAHRLPAVPAARQSARPRLRTDSHSERTDPIGLVILNQPGLCGQFPRVNAMFPWSGLPSISEGDRLRPGTGAH